MDFRQPYKQKEFMGFLSNFLPDAFEQTKEQINLPDLSFKPDIIKKVKLMGNVPSLEDLHVYEIYHESEADPRVTLSRETFRLMSNYGVRKALAVFVSENSPNYRFSLVTIDLKLKGSCITKEYSNPRRYSFYLGPDAKIHTPAKYLSEKVKDYKDLQERFSIEVVTKEFFKELSNWYFWALKKIKCPKDAEEEPNGRKIFTIRLITRLIFIWFMKQKGLVPENLFNCIELKKILKDLSKNESFYYKAILQNLFFATLNTPIKNRDFRTQKTYHGANKDFMNPNVYRFHDFFIDSQNMKSIFNNIPFLNGGLFECLDRIENEGKYIRIDGFSDRKDSQANVPNFLFFSKEHDEDLNKDYGTKNKKYKVRGIVDLLQTYNFTIDESTPIDVEIALDPELLGRVFENLLASYNPETATTARKATGSYYTPREIVDYMVTQSIKEHFKTKLPNIENIDNKLDSLLSYDSEENSFNDKETDILINLVNNLKIIDPAVGSGAFAMGILQKLVLVLSKLDSHNEKWKNQQIKSIEENIQDIILKKELIEKIEDNFRKNELDYGRKLYLIQNCIYGVDIQPIAIQIAKLRFFISLLVDEKRDREQDENYGIEPLPNLELKFISANSLIGLNLKGQLKLKDPNITNLEEKLKRVREIYFRTSAINKKEKLRKEDKEIRDKISSLLKQGGFASEDSKKIADWEPYNSNQSADWFDPEWMFGIHSPSPFEKGGEGGFDIVIANPPYFLYQGHHKEEIASIKKSPLYELCKGGKLNAYKLFLAKSSFLSKKRGLIVLIFQNSFLADNAAINIRKHYLENHRILILDSFPERDDYNKRVFEPVKMSVCILLSINEKKNDYKFVLRVWESKKMLTNWVTVFSKSSIKRYDEKTWQIPYLRESEKDLFDKLFRGERNHVKCYEGEINMTFHKYLLSQYKKNPPVIKGAAVQRYFVTKKMSQGILEYLNESLYLENNSGTKANHHNFDRVVMQGITGVDDKQRIIMAIIKKGTYCANSCNYIMPNEQYDIKFLLGLFNSKITNWMFKRTSTNSNVNCYEIEAIPVPSILESKQELIISIVEKILNLTNDEGYSGNSEKQSKVKALAAEIDQIVYKLYDLTPEEIKIVEGAIK